MTEGNLEFIDDTNYVIEDNIENNTVSPSEQLNELINLIKNNDLEIIKEKLVSNPELINLYDINDSNILTHAIINKNNEIATYLVTNYPFEKSISPQYGFNSLHIAVSLDIGMDILDILLSKGADVHATTNKGLSILAVAVTHNNINAIENLLKHGADINQNSNGYLPLMNAARFDGDELIKFLLSKGSLINAQGTEGKTALMIAACHNNMASITTLLECGADKEIQSLKGFTALDYAKQEHCRDASKFLDGNIKKSTKKKIKVTP
jgi:ankyrin repeat protein